MQQIQYRATVNTASKKEKKQIAASERRRKSCSEHGMKPHSPLPSGKDEECERPTCQTPLAVARQSWMETQRKREQRGRNEIKAGKKNPQRSIR
jgi:hypothetical protein